MAEKLKLLSWADTPTICTGFGIVSKYILKSLHNTGKYEIDVLGINYSGDFYSKEDYPYNIQPAKLLNPKDPFGQQMLINALLKTNYDYLYINNDTYVTHNSALKIKEVLTKLHRKTRIVYYYPVDCLVPYDKSDLIKVSDLLVTYTEWAKDKTIQVLPQLKDKIKVIPHGVDTSIYKPLDKEQRKAIRKKFFNVEDDNTFILINVNRNSLRKDLARTILAFKELRKRIPNSKLYLHTNMVDQNLNLHTCLWELGLKLGEDVLVPQEGYSPAKPFPDHILNQLYNASDCFLTTALGEGWGLSGIEAMAAGIPVIGPNNSAFPEVVGDTRGILYPCKEQIFVDSSGYRWWGRMDDILDAVMKVYNMLDKDKKEMYRNAQNFVKEHTWNKIGDRFVQLFDEDQKNKDKVVHIDKQNDMVISSELV